MDKLTVKKEIVDDKYELKSLQSIQKLILNNI